MASRKSPAPASVGAALRRHPRLWAAAGVTGVAVLVVFSLTEYESYASLYDADYVGASVCGSCHTLNYTEWERSPHAKMTRPAGPDSVVGNFDDATWTIPPASRKQPGDELPVARMYRDEGGYMMALRPPRSGEFVPFPIDYVIGYQYRQTYLTREPGGVLRRLPLQWSADLEDFFPYWNMQEGSDPSAADLWAQMQPLNSAWNLFCARCHTTKLTVVSKDAAHTVAETQWVDDGIACEACHGPGSQHVNYMQGNPVNRVVAFMNSRLRGQPVAYIASAQKLTKGESLSVCARCHGSDIFRHTQDTYRLYEPGYSKEGRINDLSAHFREAPLEPGRTQPTVETWADARPKGIGMLFRSFVESACYTAGEVRCYDCHDPHDNKLPSLPGRLHASDESNAYCTGCHTAFAGRAAAHTRHDDGKPGSFCYDCHMPRHIINKATGVARRVRTHTMSDIPQPGRSLELGVSESPNACNDCHRDRSAQWAQTQIAAWK